MLHIEETSYALASVALETDFFVDEVEKPKHTVDLVGVVVASEFLEPQNSTKCLLSWRHSII
jgi:hypothetical protein